MEDQTMKMDTSKCSMLSRSCESVSRLTHILDMVFSKRDYGESDSFHLCNLERTDKMEARAQVCIRGFLLAGICNLINIFRASIAIGQKTKKTHATT
jgi:hypothetical protein